MNRRRTTSEWSMAVDPGLWRCGVAMFRDAGLVAVAEVEVSKGSDVVPAVQAWAGATVRQHANTVGLSTANVRWYAEMPQSYPGDSVKEATLEALRAVVVALHWPLTTYRPSVWKGQVPKDIHHRRIRRLLTPAEAALVDALPRDRDALDAVGIGLYALGRSERGGLPVEVM